MLTLIEELYTQLVEAMFPQKRLLKPFPRLTYAEAIAKYATEKPDLRFGLEISDISDIAEITELRVFRSALSDGGVVKGFSASGCATYTRSQLDELVEFVKMRGAGGLVYIALTGDSSSVDGLTEGPGEVTGLAFSVA